MGMLNHYPRSRLVFKLPDVSPMRRIVAAKVSWRICQLLLWHRVWCHTAPQRARVRFSLSRIYFQMDSKPHPWVCIRTSQVGLRRPALSTARGTRGACWSFRCPFGGQRRLRTGDYRTSAEPSVTRLAVRSRGVVAELEVKGRSTHTQKRSALSATASGPRPGQTPLLKNHPFREGVRSAEAASANAAHPGCRAGWFRYPAMESIRF